MSSGASGRVFGVGCATFAVCLSLEAQYMYQHARHVIARMNAVSRTRCCVERSATCSAYFPSGDAANPFH